MRKVSFYPGFQVRLVQMMRHGETIDAIRLAFAEFVLSLNAKKKGAKRGSEEVGGPVMVPRPDRARDQGYAVDDDDDDDGLAQQHTRRPKGPTHEPGFG